MLIEKSRFTYGGYIMKKLIKWLFIAFLLVLMFRLVVKVAVFAVAFLILRRVLFGDKHVRRMHQQAKYQARYNRRYGKFNGVFSERFNQFF